jgi:hypothetical protein
LLVLGSLMMSGEHYAAASEETGAAHGEEPRNPGPSARLPSRPYWKEAAFLHFSKMGLIAFPK